MKPKETEQALEKSAKKLFYSGKSRFARAADGFAFCALCALSAFTAANVFRVSQPAGGIIAALTAAAAAIGVGAVRELRYRAFLCETRKRIRGELFRSKVLLADEGLLSEILRSLEPRFPRSRLLFVQKHGPIDADDILTALRGINALSTGAEEACAPPFDAGNAQAAQPVFLTLCEPTASARECAFLNGKIRPVFAPAAELEPFSERFSVDESEIDGEMIRRAKLKPPKRDRPAAGFAANGSVKYFGLGAILFAASFLLKGSLYYRTLGMICFAIAARISFFRRVRAADQV